MEAGRAEVYRLYDMEEAAGNKLLYMGGIVVGAASMLAAPWATVPLLSFATGAFSTLYSVDQADQGNQIYDAVQGWDSEAEIHSVVEIENPVLNTMYHIAGNMALDHSVASIVQAGSHFHGLMNHVDDLSMPDYTNEIDGIWHLDAEDVSHLDDADNVAGVNVGHAQQQANVGNVKTSYGKSIEISEQQMYQQGQHYNKHGRNMGYSGKKEYEQAARDFFEQNKNTAEIYEGVWNSSRGEQRGQVQIIIRNDGKQLIINKASGQIIDFYEGTSLDGFINIKRRQ